MQVEIFERKEGRLECRTYELPDSVVRVLVDSSRTIGGSYKEVWGFDAGDHQHDGKLIDTDTNVILMG